jgi:hypothetical protein
METPKRAGATPAIVATVGALLVEKRKNFLFHEKVDKLYLLQGRPANY